MFRTWLSASFEKNRRGSEIPSNDRKQFRICAARKEYEGCTVSFFSDTDLRGLKFVCTQNLSGLEYTVFEEHFIKIDGIGWPDPLLPFPGTFDMKKGETYCLLLRFMTNSETGEGDHTVKFAVLDGGIPLSEISVTVHVWNFSLPSRPTFETAVWLGHNSLAVHSGLGPKFSQIHDKEDTVITPDIKEEFNQIYKKYYDFLLEYKISVAGLPYDILDERADRYLDNPQITTVFLNNKANNEELRKRYDKIKSNPEWFGKMYMYPYDEPHTSTMLDEQKAMIDGLRAICPQARYGCAYFTNVTHESGADQLDFMSEYIDILCPKLHMFQSVGYRDRLLKLRSSGKKIWSYVCWEPGKPYVNLFLNEPGLDHRLMIWQMHRAGAEGFLYWNATYWRFTSDPWEDMATVKWLTDKVYGDGSLLYPGLKFGIDGPCPSIRLEALRDGIEDCEMLIMAEKLIGEEAFTFIDRLSTGVIAYTDSAEEFLSVREELGNRIEAELSKNT